MNWLHKVAQMDVNQILSSVVHGNGSGQVMDITQAISLLQNRIATEPGNNICNELAEAAPGFQAQAPDVMSKILRDCCNDTLGPSPQNEQDPMQPMQPMDMQMPMLGEQDKPMSMPSVNVS